MATRRRVTPVSTVSAANLGLATRLPSPTQIPDTQALLGLLVGKVEVNITKDATLEQVEESMKLALRGFRLMSDAIERIKPIIGRHLLHVAEHRLYHPKYRGITEYIEGRMELDFGVSRNNCFEALRIAKGTPSMSAEAYQKYGATRLLAAVSVLQEADEGFKPLLDESLRMTTKDFKEKVRVMREAKEPAESFTVTLHLPIAYKATWDSLLGDLGLTAGDLVVELVQSYIETHQGEAKEPALVRGAAG